MSQFKKDHQKSLVPTLLTLGLSFFSTLPSAEAANDVALVSGAFRRSISVSDLEYLAETGNAKGLLKDVLKLSNQKPKVVSKLLNKKVKLPLSLTSRLLSTKIGNVIITRISKIIYPLNVQDPSTSVPAFRAGVINGMQIEEDGLNAILFMKAYPSKTMAINIPEFFSVIKKTKSITSLIRFFSESPLGALKEAKP